MAIGDIINGINAATNALNGSNPLTQDPNSFRSDGFILPATFQADGNGLPSSKVSSYNNGIKKRNIITWFVPQFGTVKMYVNPNSIVYSHKKLINKDRTKGGYTLQYWGEDLDTLNISGTTGSAGIEGINVLYEIYRAEQFAFDGSALTIAANNAATQLSNSISGAISGGSAESIGGSIGGAVGGILGMDPVNSNLSVQNIPSLAQMAFSVEMFYNGWVYRGFFDNMTITERAENFLFDYQMTFMATQRRGYRTNYFPWHRSANQGPSNYNTPYSFSGHVERGF